jgi:subfamily B ATP-binding cassette protein MsbA
MQFDRDPNDVVDAAVNNAIAQTFYEVRTHLNPMIGFLQLMVDDLVDSPEEREELTEESYKSAIRLLKNLEVLEENSKLVQAESLTSAKK